MARALSTFMVCTQQCVRSSRISRIGLLVLVSVLWVMPLARAQSTETITATAHVKTKGGVEASAPVTITVDRFSTETERNELLAALKQGGTAAVRKLLGTRQQVGSVKVGTTVTPIKYVYARTTAAGRLITAVTGSPIAFVGAGLPDAPPKTGFDLGLVLLDLATSGSGQGELVPATKVRVNEQGALVTDDYSGEVFQLSNVVRK
jgi:hypothetical protein